MSESLKEDFRTALRRLREGKQESPSLRGRRVRISVKTVALEAGHSRNNLYQNGFEGILDEIRASRPRAPHVTKKKNRDAKLDSVTAEVEQLRSEVKKLASVNLTLYHRAVQAERRVERLQEKLRGNVRELKAR